MGNAVFWYYPDPDEPTAERVDVGRPLTDREGPLPFVNQQVYETYTGVQTTTHFGGKAGIGVKITGRLGTDVSGRSLRRQLYNMINHLQRGGWVMLAENEDYAFAAFASRPPAPGNSLTTFAYYDNLFETLNSGNDISNREVVIQSDYQAYISEMKICTTHNPTKCLLNTGNLLFRYSDSEYTLIREATSWPALRLPTDQRNGDFLPHDHEIVFTLDLPLEEDVATIAYLSSIAGKLPGTSGGGFLPGGVGGTVPPIDVGLPSSGGWTPGGVIR